MKPCCYIYIDLNTPDVKKNAFGYSDTTESYVDQGGIMFSLLSS